MSKGRYDETFAGEDDIMHEDQYISTVFVRLAQVLKTFFINVPYYISVACLTLMDLDENF